MGGVCWELWGWIQSFGHSGHFQGLGDLGHSGHFQGSGDLGHSGHFQGLGDLGHFRVWAVWVIFGNLRYCRNFLFINTL